MKQLGEGQFYLVREDVLTESMLKMLEAKRLLASGEESTIQDATKRVGLSRSAFYKYRDTVYPFESIARERILTIFIQLEDRKGSLATLLQIVSGRNAMFYNSPNDSCSSTGQYYLVTRCDRNDYKNGRVPATIEST